VPSFPHAEIQVTTHSGMVVSMVVLCNYLLGVPNTVLPGVIQQTTPLLHQ